MTLDALEINTNFEDKFETLNQKDEVWSYSNDGRPPRFLYSLGRQVEENGM